MKRIGDMGEDALIERLLREVPLGSGAAGPGDDCAVMEGDGPQLQLLKTDAMVEGIHWNPSTEARRVGWKATARVASDFAAMGGSPTDFLITITLPASTPLDWATGLYAGMGECLKAHGGRIVGGETTRAPDGAPMVISVSAAGTVPRDRLVLRSGARPGDTLLVTGQLGGSLGGKHLDFVPRTREAAWLSQHHKPSAMMDISDGLAKDLPRLAHASGCGFQLKREAIPCTTGCGIEQACSDGEDYELLFAIASSRIGTLIDAWQDQFPELALTPIGTLCPVGEGDSLEGGWDHFGPAAP